MIHCHSEMKISKRLRNSWAGQEGHGFSLCQSMITVHRSRYVKSSGNIFSRVARGVPAETARADLQRIAGVLGQSYPKDDKGIGFRMEPSSAWVASDTTRRALWVLLGAVTFLLLIGCVNIANLLLARGMSRKREIAVRTALGAGRARLVRFVMMESVLLSGFGAALGLALAYVALRAIQALEIRGIPRLADAGLNPWVLGFAALIAVLTGVLWLRHCRRRRAASPLRYVRETARREAADEGGCALRWSPAKSRSRSPAGGRRFADSQLHPIDERESRISDGKPAAVFREHAELLLGEGRGQTVPGSVFRTPLGSAGTLAGQSFDVFRKLRPALKTMLARDDELGVGRRT